MLTFRSHSNGNQNTVSSKNMKPNIKTDSINVSYMLKQLTEKVSDK